MSTATAGAPVGNGLTWEALVTRALTANASDVHMHVDADLNGTVRARIDGVLVPWGQLPPQVVGPALTRMRTAANLATGASLLVGEGRIRVDGADLRLTITPLVSGGVKVALRLPSVDLNWGLGDLGLSEHNLSRVQDLLAYPDGLVLTTGPVGAGKTTTLLALLDEVGGPARSVVTVEDPVERVVPGADQIEVRVSSGFTYEHILRSLLRMDMDALLIGEIRDRATAEHAVQIAKAGRLVLSTLHAGSSVGAVLRLHELSGLGPREVSESLRGVISQRLVRRVHDACQGTGCGDCLWTGFSGRVPVHEVLRVDDPFREAWVAGAGARELQHMALDAGMRTFVQDGERWLTSGVSTHDELERVLGRGR